MTERPSGAPPFPDSPSAGLLAARFLRTAANAPADLPLPTTREFGKRFGVASATAYRVLQKLSHDGEIWQHPTSGRYYPSAARALLDRPKPVACLIRRLELDSEQYREMLEGISVGCGVLHRTMLLWHDELLVNHPESHNPPEFADAVQQRAILEDFLTRHGADAGGFILDHIWDNEVLRGQSALLKPAVVLFRACAAPEFSNIRADFRSGALKALAHLLGRGFEHIVPVLPFAADPAVTEFFAALDRAVDDTGCRDRLGKQVPATNNRQRTALIDTLQRTKRRTALVCPEDNVSAFLCADLRAARIRIPGQVGVMSVMGTDVAADAGITCLRYDFRAMGRLAVDALGNRTPVQHVLEPVLFAGTTT